MNRNRINLPADRVVFTVGFVLAFIMAGYLMALALG